ncbi:hypothetical protein VTL71DRAFT_685, partial [Oculimacula yallundae]
MHGGCTGDYITYQTDVHAVLLPCPALPSLSLRTFTVLYSYFARLTHLTSLPPTSFSLSSTLSTSPPPYFASVFYSNVVDSEFGLGIVLRISIAGILSIPTIHQDNLTAVVASDEPASISRQPPTRSPTLEHPPTIVNKQYQSLFA